MDLNLRHLAAGELTDSLPETPHELPFDRGKIDELVDRVRQGEPVDLLTEMLACVDWRGSFTEPDGRPITIEDNVWLGARVIVLGGVTIGADSCIGAGSVVVDDIPPRSLAVGVPARVIRQL